MADIDRLIHALIEAQADPTEEAITRCLGMARAMRDQPVRGRGGWLRAMRKSAGLTMADAASHAGITVSYVSAMEHDQCGTGMTGKVTWCVICGGEVFPTVEGVAFAGIPAVEGFSVQPGLAHEVCARAPEVLQRWLVQAEELDAERDAAPVDEMADWLRDGGQLSELAALSLLDELCQSRQEATNGERE